jgi:D-beta-D-heptose 7-phosphate kinase/D-beta-D-heptose 1-phosphate adenosyltransferase
VLSYIVIKTNKIIFTNGCFDVLHIGHIRLLNYCSSFGYVIVGLNSDKSVRDIKGPDRPINNQFLRKEFLENLSSVGKVIIFDQPTPKLLINEIKPDLIVKGGDYEASKVVGSDDFEVKIFPRVEDFSSSALIEHMKYVSENAHGTTNSTSTS